jgi:phage protein D
VHEKAGFIHSVHAEPHGLVERHFSINHQWQDIKPPGGKEKSWQNQEQGAEKNKEKDQKVGKKGGKLLETGEDISKYRLSPIPQVTDKQEKVASKQGAASRPIETIVRRETSRPLRIKITGSSLMALKVATR